MSVKPRILEGADVLPALEPAGGLPRRTAKPSKRPKGKCGAGRFGVLNAFVDVTLRELDRTAAAVWLVLFRDTKPNGLACTSQTDIARRAGVSVRTVYRALRRLVRLGLLVVVRKGRLNVGASVYRLRATADGQCAGRGELI
ncbi:MAG: helix-turn-helix domain-containing protein [Phycisphaerae bacterium]